MVQRSSRGLTMLNHWNDGTRRRLICLLDSTKTANLGRRNNHSQRTINQKPQFTDCRLRWPLISLQPIFIRGRSVSSTATKLPPKLPPGYRYKTAKHKNTTTIGQNSENDKVEESTNLLIKAGLPFILFTILASWVVGNAYSGKLKEMEASQGKVSISLRQAAIQKEHDEIVERINTIVTTDFDNTKRIKRPEEILEERRKERERRNAWHRRFYRWIASKEE